MSWKTTEHSADYRRVVAVQRPLEPHGDTAGGADRTKSAATTGKLLILLNKENAKDSGLLPTQAHSGADWGITGIRLHRCIGAPTP